jgi:hypothetical protein
MFGVYRTLLRAVSRQGAGIFTAKVRASKPRLMAAALATLACGTKVWR